jgi:hypothetical protein
MRPAIRSVADPSFFTSEPTATDSSPRGNGDRRTRDGRPVQVYNLTYLPKWLGGRVAGEEGPVRPRRDVGGALALAVALIGLVLLAAAMGYVSYKAQRGYIAAHKAGQDRAVTLEALGLDAGAVIFAALAFAAALRGRTALRARVGNLACVAGSVAMNAMSADFGSVGSVAVWVLPAVLYAGASDTLVVEIQARVLDRRGHADAQASLAGMVAKLARGVGGTLLWLLRLLLAARSTMGGFRAWVIETAPVAPGRRAAPTPVELSTFTGFGRWVVDPPAQPDTGGAGQADTRADTVAGQPDTKAVTPAGTADKPPVVRGGHVRPVRRSRPARPASRPDNTADNTADKARAMLAAEPDMSGAELGRRLGVSERTGRRLYARITGRIDGADTTDSTTDTTAHGGQQS